MKLKTYLKKNKITQAEFAASIGVSKQAVVWWVSKNDHRRRPNTENLRKIKSITKGKVTANDFA
jgi:transcriptional regulator with XRE-family HTH domain